MKDALKLLNSVPFGELVGVQKQLSLTANQIWYIATYWATPAEGDTELSEITGVPRTTIRDIRQSLADAGLFNERDGFTPLIARMAELRGERVAIQPMHPPTPPFESLDAYEQLLVLDQFTCRICFNKWNMNGSCGTGFRIRKVADGESVFASRAIICNDCTPALNDQNILDRLRLYLRHRSERLNSLSGHALTDLEYSCIMKIRAKKAGSNPAAELSVATNSELVTTNSPADKLDAISDERASGLTRESAYVPDEVFRDNRVPRAEHDTVNSGIALLSEAKTASESNGEPRAAASLGRGGKKKSISSAEEEPTEELENADVPKCHDVVRERKASKRAQAILEKNAKRLEKIRDIPYEEWTAHDMTIYFWDKHYRKYGYAQNKEAVTERQKHVNDMLLSLEGSVAEFIKFTNWVMDNWHTLWFAHDDTTPTTRNVSSRMGDIMPVYFGGTRDIAIQQTRANPHIDTKPQDIPDWVLKPAGAPQEKEPEEDGKEPKLKFPDWVGKE